jgi:malate dehydrogenase (quinone)
VAINEQFQVSLQFWAYMVAAKMLDAPTTFINSSPHMTFVWGEANVEYLRKRFAVLKDQPLFAGMEYSEDPAVIAQWTPLLMDGRTGNEPVAATRVTSGTDVDYGALTKQLLAFITAQGATVSTGKQVTSLSKLKNGHWKIKLRDSVGNTPHQLTAKFVFVGAGGGALALLQSAGISEAKGFGGFPISGQFLRTTNPAIVARHQAKVYGKASVGAPPMSVPHLDTRVVEGEKSLLFGPFAGFTPKFLKEGSWFDLPGSIRTDNIIPMVAVGATNLDLIKYLVGEVVASPEKKLNALREFFPDAQHEDWELITAGQRVQVMKKDPKKGGVLQFGTEVISAADGSIAGLLGASPGASVSVPIMLDVLQRCFPKNFTTWEPEIKKMIPSFGTRLSDNPEVAKKSFAASAQALKLSK